jgi:hypothetical protein
MPAMCGPRTNVGHEFLFFLTIGKVCLGLGKFTTHSTR